MVIKTKTEAKSTLVVMFDPRSGFEFTFRGEWNRRMLDQIQKKLYRHLKVYKQEMRRKEDERRAEESGDAE